MSTIANCSFVVLLIPDLCNIMLIIIHLVRMLSSVVLSMLKAELLGNHLVISFIIRGSKSRNKVSVGEHAEGSLPNGNFSFCLPS